MSAVEGAPEPRGLSFERVDRRRRLQARAWRSLPMVLLVALTLSASAGPELWVWEGAEWLGVRPEPQYEDDPWVQAVRAAQEAQVLALNSGDFSHRRLRLTWAPELVHGFVDETRDRLRDGRAQVLAGPDPFQPLVITVDVDQERAVVSGCADRPVRVQQSVEPEATAWPTVESFTVELGPDGERRVVDHQVGEAPDVIVEPDGDALTPELCRTVDIARAAIVPVPDLYGLAAKRPEDVVPPPYETWGDGVPGVSVEWATR